MGPHQRQDVFADSHQGIKDSTPTDETAGRKFLPHTAAHVHHRRLIKRLGQQIRDSQILKLTGRMLKAKVVMPDGAGVSADVGTLQGGSFSPLLSNGLLNEFEQELSR